MEKEKNIFFTICAMAWKVEHTTQEFFSIIAKFSQSIDPSCTNIASVATSP
jgi:hypothetical protein